MIESLESARRAHDKGLLLNSTLRNIERWLTDPVYSEFRPAIERMIAEEKWSDLNDSFYTRIPFGTGGRRGTEGIGPNRINTRTIAESAAGLAAYLVKKSGDAREQGVVVAYDTRRNSRAYADLTAEVLAAEGVRVFLFDGYRPTPELSFAIRHLKAAAGVVITASHNPPRDNGFKAYGPDGGQVVPPDDQGITDEVNRVEKIDRMPIDRARMTGLVRTIGPDVDRAYIDSVCGLNLTEARDLEFVYSPLHGTGAVCVVPALERLGFSGLRVVQEQAVPDPEFSTVPGGKPNPEETRSMGLALKRADELGADLVMASDPDADRLGAAARGRDGNWIYLTGNQVGALLCWFVCDRLRAAGKLRGDGVVIETLVSTDLAKRIAVEHGLEVIDHLLVGFKWIAAAIGRLSDESRFVFAFEESLGYLMGDFVRDKDAVIAAVLLAQCAAHLRSEGLTLLDQLDRLMERHGVFIEIQESIFLEGAQGAQKMERIMAELRRDPPRELGGAEVVAVTDRDELIRIYPDEGRTERLTYDRGDVLVFHLSEDLSDRITVRPSGTEPKIKHYAQLSLPYDAAAGMNAIRERARERAGAAINALRAIERSIAG